jgi:hypothetical protein
MYHFAVLMVNIISLCFSKLVAGPLNQWLAKHSNETCNSLIKLLVLLLNLWLNSHMKTHLIKNSALGTPCEH